MRRRLTVLLMSLVTALAIGAAPVGAHPLTPPGNAKGAPGGLPMPGTNPGHNGVQCAAEAGAPAFSTSLGAFECPAP